MTPNTSSDNEINIYCDWLTDNGHEHLANEIRFDELDTNNCWAINTYNQHTKVGTGNLLRLIVTISKNVGGSAKQFAFGSHVGSGVPTDQGIDGRIGK